MLQIFMARQSIYDSFINNVYPHASAASPLQMVYKTILAVSYLTYISHTNNHHKWMEEMEEHGYILRTKCIKNIVAATPPSTTFWTTNIKALCVTVKQPCRSASGEASVQGVTL